MDNKQPISSGQPYTAVFTQPTNSPQGADMSQPMGPTQMAQPMQSAGMPNVGMPNSGIASNPITGQPMMMQASPSNIPVIKRDVKSLVKTIVIIALSLVSVTFIGLFIWMFTNYNAAKTNVDGQIAEKVAEAVDSNTEKLETEFAEREKYPFRTFAGPADYGELTFEYPKTWSLYIPQDAANGGELEAYFNPVEIYAISDATINSLRLSIREVPFESAISAYQGEIQGDNPNMRLDLVTIGKENNINANLYSGKIPGTEFNGYVTIFKIRDKTVTIRTDSLLFDADYKAILSSIRFNA